MLYDDRVRPDTCIKVPSWHIQQNDDLSRCSFFRIANTRSKSASMPMGGLSVWKRATASK